MLLSGIERSPEVLVEEDDHLCFLAIINWLFLAVCALTLLKESFYQMSLFFKADSIRDTSVYFSRCFLNLIFRSYASYQPYYCYLLVIINIFCLCWRRVYIFNHAKTVPCVKIFFLRYQFLIFIDLYCLIILFFSPTIHVFTFSSILFRYDAVSGGKTLTGLERLGGI